MSESLYVLGRYPPPIDGQAIASRQLADLLEEEYDVERIDLAPDESGGSGANVRFDGRRALAYARHRWSLPRRLAARPDAPILWTAISPTPLGHLRDRTIVLPALPADRPVVAVVHWGNFDRLFRSSLTGWSARRMIDRLRAVVLLSPHLSEQLAPWIPDEKRHVIPNTLDPEVRCRADEIEAKIGRRSEAPSRPLRLLFLSNMTPSKGYLDALEATRILHEAGTSVRLDLIGAWESDEDREAFGERVRAAHLEDQVRHHGRVEDRSVVRQMHLEADLFLLPTYYPVEAQPLTVIEALNAGTPVVVTRQGGLSEMIEDGEAGIFVPRRAPERIADAARTLSRPSAWARHARSARERYESTFSPSAVRKKWQALIEKLDHPTDPPRR